MRKIVFAVDFEGTVVAKPVTLGPIYEGLRVVRAGLTIGDWIVIDGIANPMVRPGAKVKPEPGDIKAVMN